jgi:chromosome partitioning protein
MVIFSRCFINERVETRDMTATKEGESSEHPEKEPRAVAVSMLKGGHGKTTVSFQLGYELANRNGKALLVDLDDNGHLTLNLGLTHAFNDFSDPSQLPDSSDEKWVDNHVYEVLINDTDPQEYIVEREDGLDVFPSHTNLEFVESQLKEEIRGDARLRQKFTEPLLGDEYDYIVFDCPASRGKLTDNAMYAAQNLLIPMRPESGYETGLKNTLDRLVVESREHFDLRLLAVVPTDLDDRIDIESDDRELLLELHGRDNVTNYLPNFAYLSPEDWDAVNNGDTEGRLPGIRARRSIDKSNKNGVPLRKYDPECDQLPAFEELAQIVERGQVVRDE